MAPEPGEQHDSDALSSDLAVYAARLIRLIRRNRASSAGLRVLSILDESGPLGVSALAQVDQCSQPTMTGQVQQLVESGWVTKQINPADARGSLIALSAVGRAELSRFRTASADLLAERLRHHPELTPDDLATAVAVLRAVVDDPIDPLTEAEPTMEGRQ